MLDFRNLTFSSPSCARDYASELEISSQADTIEPSYSPKMIFNMASLQLLEIGSLFKFLSRFRRLAQYLRLRTRFRHNGPFDVATVPRKKLEVSRYLQPSRYNTGT